VIPITACDNRGTSPSTCVQSIVIPLLATVVLSG
jgi:hypothetical protein